MLKHIIRVRDLRVHISALMLLMIVDKLQNTTGSAFFAEIDIYYQAEKTSKGTYTQSGIRSMLRTMENRGFLYSIKDGKYKNYHMTTLGKVTISKFI